MRTLLVALVLVLLPAACARAQAANTTPQPARAALPLVIKRSGGLAGLADRLVVRPSGRATLTHRDGERVRLPASATRALRAAFRHSRFATLASHYAAPGDVAVADGMDYVFRAGGRTVKVDELAQGVPGRLVRLKQAAAGLMSG